MHFGGVVATEQNVPQVFVENVKKKYIKKHKHAKIYSGHNAE